MKIVDSIQDRGINQVIAHFFGWIVSENPATVYLTSTISACQMYIIGGDGTQKGASAIFEVRGKNNRDLFSSLV